ncbi:MAG: 50S ribosome-binding GTPase, partial [Deltaproteobacteria bacterium]|nr:50S ribosome-binding GTPase [Deltaproteobacteria bacterium]
MASKTSENEKVKRETICAIASGQGEGAVGVLRISGPEARVFLERASGRGSRARRLQRRVLREPKSKRRVDEVLACWMPGPHSYTGEDVVEVFGHGGEVNMRGLLELFCALGAREARPGEFTRRAFLEGRLDLTQAEAVAEIIEAKSERALQNAQAVLAGELGARVRGFRGATVDIAAELEAAIDFVDEAGFGEEVGFGRSSEELIEALEGIRKPLGRLIERARDAVRLDGISVALVGPVNVGKSSLFNALVDEERALVSGEAGTTRDYLEADVKWGGVRVRLVDTAGERGEGEMTPLEREGRRLAADRGAR